jgi:hypothetical protein
MAQPQWITPAGSLGVIPEGVFYQQNLRAVDPDDTTVNYLLIAGELPAGIQLNTSGQIVGIPSAVARLQGVPFQVSEDVTSKFTVRAYTNQTPPRISDRTFTLTVTGDDSPEFETPPGPLTVLNLNPAPGDPKWIPANIYYDSDFINAQLVYTDTDPNDTVVVKFVGGELPGGVTVSETGLISGYIQPAANIDKPPGYDFTPIYTEPYDFIVSAVSKNYQFTLEVTDGKNSSLRTFEFFVYDRASITADNTTIFSSSTVVTADETTVRKPFLVNAFPSNLGSIRGDNYYSYQFIGNDYDTPVLKYAIGVNQGVGLPPGLVLDPNSGWLYGYVPDQGITEVDYSFNIVVYEADFNGTPISCTATAFGTNRITCDSTSQLGVGQPLVFTGTGFGGIDTSPTTVYYVLSVVSSTEFTVTDRLGSTSSVTLTTSSGIMAANLIVASDPYPFELNISGSIDAEVTWISNTNLGSIDNGAVSLFKVEAVNRGGRELQYRLQDGAFNELPQGLKLLPTGEISGRVSFNTFSIDLGRTTFDQNTTWDSRFTFTVNAYAEDTEQLVFDVSGIRVIDGGSGYSEVSPPAIEFSSPVGASAETAQVGNVTIESGSITAVEVSNSGAGYLNPATVVITEGFGGTGAELEAIMRPTGVQDVVSVFKTFTITVTRANNKPYQNLVVQAMPPENDRVLIDSLLNNQEIFVPEYIFRPTDPYFGKAQSVVYEHAFGLNPETIDRYVESLYKNHYWKNIVLGSIETAQAVDSQGNVIYEVVYSRIIDNLLNDQGRSVSKIVNLPYAITNPLTSEITTQVYPNSLTNMRDQVIDVVGQQSTKLPLWMTSRQSSGRVLGFTPAWVLCYTKPGRSNQIAYYLNTQFGQQLNKVDFKIDRYILDRELSRNWDPITQSWTPAATLTTFDRFNTSGNTFVGTVDIATDLAYSDVNNRTLEYINSLGGLDGVISTINNNSLIFVKQEGYSNYSNSEDAWQKYVYPYDSTVYDADNTEFDEATTIPNSPVNQRMAIYRISVDPVTEIVTLTLDQQTAANQYVQIQRGSFYRSAQLRYPTSPGTGLTVISWLPLETLVTTETFFDQGSVSFVEPVDMYDPSDSEDKYLVFPKSNILE